MRDRGIETRRHSYPSIKVTQIVRLHPFTPINRTKFFGNLPHFIQIYGQARVWWSHLESNQVRPLMSQSLDLRAIGPCCPAAPTSIPNVRTQGFGYGRACVLHFHRSSPSVIPCLLSGATGSSPSFHPLKLSGRGLLECKTIWRCTSAKFLFLSGARALHKHSRDGEAEKIRLPLARFEQATSRTLPLELQRHIDPTRIALETLVPLRLLRAARYNE